MIKTIPELFWYQVEKYGPRVSLRKKEWGIWKTISWTEYGAMVSEVTLGLISIGLPSREKVAILSENRPEWAFIDLGILSAGCITVPIYPTNSPKQVEYVLNHSGSISIFVEDEEQLDKVLEVRDRCPSLLQIIVIDPKGLRDFQDPKVMEFSRLLGLGKERSQESRGGISERLREIHPSDLATVVYTSGTTGPPKGVMLSHANIINGALNIVKSNPLLEGDNVVSYLPLSHVAERCFSIFWAIQHGLVVNFLENKNTFAENIREISPQIFFGVPRVWEKFYSQITLAVGESSWWNKTIYRWCLEIGQRVAHLRLAKKAIPFSLQIVNFMAYHLIFKKIHEALGLDKARLMLCGAAPVSPDVLDFFHSIGLDVKEIYGQTETCGPITIHFGKDIKLGTVGKPIPGVDIKLEEDGEISVKGESNFLGYLNDPEETDSSKRNGWLHTGDIGEFDSEGFLKIIGRKKDIIITSGGKNIAPQYIENQLKFSPYIHDAVVIGERRKYLTVLVMIDEENVMKHAQDVRLPFTTYADLSQKPEINHLIQQEIDKVNKNLSRVEQIRQFRILDKKLTTDDEEMTPTLKLKRKYVSERFKELIENMYR